MTVVKEMTSGRTSRGREKVGPFSPSSSRRIDADTFGRHDASYIREHGGEPVVMKTQPLRPAAYSSSHEDWHPSPDDERRDSTSQTIEFRTRIPSHVRPAVPTRTNEDKAFLDEPLPTDTDPLISRRRRRILALSAAAIFTGAVVAAGSIAVLPMLHDKGGTQQAASDKKDLNLILPNPNTPTPPTAPLENNNNSNATTTIVITDKGSITDGNQWNTAAKKTHDSLGHSSTPVTNIVAKEGAYDSRSTSPDPDSAKAGDSFTTLNSAAIQTVDRLEHALSADASQAEKDAATIIHQLNNLSPMETQALIAQYGPQLESLKKDLVAILGSQTDTQPSHSLQKLAVAQSSVTETQTMAETAKKPTTIFSRIAEKAGNIIHRGSVTDGKKAIAALSADRNRRQRQLYLAV